MDIRRSIEAVLAADTATSFQDGLESGYRCLRALGPESFLKELGEHAQDALLDARRQRLHSLYAWLACDRLTLAKDADGAPTEFLWLFAVPFVVQFKRKAQRECATIKAPSFDASVFVQHLNSYHPFNETFAGSHANLRVLPTLYRREDLHGTGPEVLTKYFLDTERGLAPTIPQPKPFSLVESAPSYRTAVFYAMCVARLPANGKVDFDRNRPDEAVELAMAQVIKDFLGNSAGSVEALAPCMVGEALFVCSRAGMLEITGCLLQAQRSFKKISVAVRHVALGHAEIYAKRADGSELLLMPPFAFVEPAGALDSAVSSVCKGIELPFAGSFRVPQQSSGALN